jgi:type II secretory pathway component PulL
MPEQKKQNWFAKHKILTAIIAIIVVMYVGGSIGLSQETPTAERSLEQKQEIFYNDLLP